MIIIEWTGVEKAFDIWSVHLETPSVSFFGWGFLI